MLTNNSFCYFVISKRRNRYKKHFLIKQLPESFPNSTIKNPLGVRTMSTMGEKQKQSTETKTNTGNQKATAKQPKISLDLHKTSLENCTSTHVL